MLKVAVIVIAFDGGGRVQEYLERAAHVLQYDIPVQITGDCFSACTIFADRARQNVCVTPDARMYFHAGTNLPDMSRFQIQYSTDIDQLVGEQPHAGWKRMSYPLTTEIWRLCDEPTELVTADRPPAGDRTASVQHGDLRPAP